MKDRIVVGETFARDGTVLVRRAKKMHRCSGGHDGNRRVACAVPISAGDVYVEYVGETSPFQAGARYHPECARQQGLVTIAEAQ